MGGMKMGAGGKTAFKMGGAKKMKTSLGAKPGIFGSAAADEPDEETAPPAGAIVTQRKALTSGMPESMAGLGPSPSALAAAQAAAAAAAANAAAASSAAGLAPGFAGHPLQVQQDIANAVRTAQATLSAGGIAGMSPTMNAYGRYEPAAGVPGDGSGGRAAAGTSAAADDEPDDDEPVRAGVQRRGDYTFCRKYTRGRVVRVPECEGLRSIDSYENLGMVGKGAFNKIYKARNRETGEVVALKSMQLDAVGGTGEGLPLEMLRELSILMSLRHPNVVRVREAVVDSGSMYMVMELVDFDLGLLIEHMKRPFSEAQVKCLSMQLLSALAAVHANFVLHRDLKQTNLLLDADGVLKLCDFGLSRRCASGGAKPCTPTVTSLWYRAPEILLGETCYGSAVDVWSFGCIFAEWLQMGEPLFQGQSEPAQVDAIFRLLGTPSEHSWPAFGGLKGVQVQVQPFVENFTMSLGADGELVRMPKNALRKKFPAVGYVPPAAASAAAAPGQQHHHRTTALSDAGYELLNSALTCDPAQRVSARAALDARWLSEEPLPTPLSRREIRQLRRDRDEAIASGAHHLALAQQKAQANAAQAQASAHAIAAEIKARMGL